MAGLAELVVPAILLVVAGFLTVGTVSMVQPPSVQKPGPTFFPWIVIGVLVAMAIASTVQILRQRRRTAEDGPLAAPLTEDQLIDEDGQITGTPPDVPPGRAPWPLNAVTDWRAVLTVVGSFVALVVLLVPAGWILSAAILFWGVAYAFGSRRPIFDISIALVMSSAIQLIFGVALGLNLPAGFLEGVL
ncbi:tripartite tricarboxylate transporter TctB family protein [Nakamurella flava]|uniref:Tripartite tricarboxylate transporter TctB family protein n=1 Tax=Nakamurella flava TaxID=2576308 RepID=A0A4U6QNQ3_9ACTN|nr:tripartite tricarboxylate transporter TctB family protein [Nakamurella flava]